MLVIASFRHHTHTQEDSLILSTRFEQALTYAAILHSGQVKKGTAVPYIGHLLTVTGIALLHDAVEDAGGKGVSLRSVVGSVSAWRRSSRDALTQTSRRNPIGTNGSVSMSSTCNTRRTPRCSSSVF